MGSEFSGLETSGSIALVGNANSLESQILVVTGPPRDPLEDLADKWVRATLAVPLVNSSGYRPIGLLADWIPGRLGVYAGLAMISWCGNLSSLLRGGIFPGCGPLRY